MLVQYLWHVELTVLLVRGSSLLPNATEGTAVRRIRERENFIAVEI
jgi:hypothetical protein